MNYKSIKNRPNHREYLKILSRMTPEQKLNKVFELNETAKELFLYGLRKRFPLKSENEIWNIYLERKRLCYNRNY